MSDIARAVPQWDFVCEKFAAASEIDELIVSATFKDPDIVNLLRRYRGRTLSAQCREDLGHIQHNFARILLDECCDDLRKELKNHFKNSD
ncbi:MAG: hypothetical protein ACFFCD_17465 [Promethearchaeota archaeon]